MRIVLLLICLAALTLPGAAQAGEVDLAGADGETVIITQNLANQNNDITVTLGNAPNEVHAAEETLNMTAGTGCLVVDAKTARCPGDVIEGIASLMSGSDEFHNDTWIPFTVLGGTGVDELFGGGAGDTVYGQEGNDEVHGGNGNDTLGDDDPEGNDGDGNDKLFGDAGEDLLEAGNLGGGTPGVGAGSDTLDGGPGIDTADYSLRTAPLTITEADGQANDGQGSALLAESDNVVNAETIIGGSGADSIKGAAHANTLRGGGGDDLLRGGDGSGADVLLGENGADTLDGGPLADLLGGGRGRDTASYAARITSVTATLDGQPNDGADGEGDTIDEDVENLDGGFVADTLAGSGGPNRIRGNDGNDVVGAGPGDDIVEGNGDNDRLNGGGGNDVVAGGAGADTIAARDLAKDQIGCGPGADTVTADPFDAVAADCESVARGTGALSLPKALKVTKKRVAKILVGCPAVAQGGCSNGLVTLLARGATVRAAKFSIGAGNSEVVKMTLTKKQLGRLRKLGKPSLRATARGTAGATESVTVKLPPKP